MDFNSHVERAISTSRLSTYRARAGDDEGAWKLYRWNVELASAVVPLASDVEVTLRNTVHERLSEHFDRDDWWAAPVLLLDDQTAEMIKKVVKKHKRKTTEGRAPSGKVVARTTLAVWVNLLGRGGHSALGRVIDYDAKLWRPALRFGFSTGTYTQSGRERRPPRGEVHRRASEFLILRNRMAHHEPIFDGVRTDRPMPLLDVWDRSVELLGWMCPELGAWHRIEDRLPSVFSTAAFRVDLAMANPALGREAPHINPIAKP